MPTCVIKGCRNRPEVVKDRNESITFHRFPVQKADLMKQWLTAIGPSVLKDKVKVIHSTSVICSEHFERRHLSVKNHRTRLSPGAVPTVFPSATRAEAQAARWHLASHDEQHKKSEEYFETLVISQEDPADPRPGSVQSSHASELTSQQVEQAEVPRTDDGVTLLCLTPTQVAQQVVVVAPPLQFPEEEPAATSLKPPRKRKLDIPSLCLDESGHVGDSEERSAVEKLVILTAKSSKSQDKHKKKKLLRKIPAEMIKSKRRGNKSGLVLPQLQAASKNVADKADVVCVTDVFGPQQFCESQAEGDALTGLCRLCAAADCFMISIFGPLGLEQRLSDKIHRHLPVQVRADDRLPLQVCMSCAQSLNSIEQLAESSQEAELKLRLLLEAQEMNVEVQDVDQDVAGSAAQQELEIDRSIAATTPAAITCKDCGREFSKFKAYARHCYSLHKKKKCKACDQFFNSKQDIFQHKLQHHAVKCDCCGTSFVSINSMLNHLRREHPTFKSNTCELCGKSFNSKYGLRVHRDCHQWERPFLCDTCGKSYKTKRRLKVHKCVASLSDALDHNTCSVCGKVYTLRSSLKRHMLRHLGERRFECSVCNKKFFGSVNLKNHMVIHEKSTLYECQMCCARYFHKRNMISHLKDKHSTPWSYKCPSCDQIFQSIDEVVGHRKLHDLENIALGVSQVSEIKEGACLDFRCKVCDKCFDNIYVLTYHFEDHVVRTQEELSMKAAVEDGIYECSYCGDKVVSSWSMKRHIRKFHGEYLQPPPADLLHFECEFCAKRFATKTQLKQHVYQHTGEKPHRCPYCNAGFRTRLAVQVHSRIHTGEMPYHCLRCPKKFRSSATLRIHQAVHDRPFCCPHCGQRFPKKLVYQKHLLVHAGGGKKPALYQCGKCDYSCKTKAASKKHERSHDNEPTYLNL